MKSVFNPLKEDFFTTYDINEDAHPVSFCVRSMEIETFDDDRIADHVIKHLATQVVYARDVKTNFQDEYAKVVDEITI